MVFISTLELVVFLFLIFWSFVVFGVFASPDVHVGVGDLFLLCLASPCRFLCFWPSSGVIGVSLLFLLGPCCLC